jgi:hypothetical protein
VGKKLILKYFSSILLGMRGEVIMCANTNVEFTDDLRRRIDTFCASDKHVYLASPSDLNMLIMMVDLGVSPTLCFLDDRFPEEGDGEKAAVFLREKLSDPIIVSFSDGEKPAWSDFHLSKHASNEEIRDFLQNVRHKEAII